MARVEVQSFGGVPRDLANKLLAQYHGDMSLCKEHLLREMGLIAEERWHLDGPAAPVAASIPHPVDVIRCVICMDDTAPADATALQVATNIGLLPALPFFFVVKIRPVGPHLTIVCFFLDTIFFFLQCGHAFCTSCLRAHVTSRMEQGDAAVIQVWFVFTFFSVPVCRHLCLHFCSDLSVVHLFCIFL
jgi:hypothetical protein